MHDLPRLIRNFILSLGGEGVQSGFHFVLNLILIRLLSAYDFGVFAIAFVIGGIAITYGNALVSVPAAVHMPRLKSPGAMNYQDVVFGSIALVFALLVGVVVSAGLFVTLGDVEAAAGGAFVGLWTLRNHMRTVMFVRRMTTAVTLSDVSYTASGIALVAAALWLDQEGERVTSVLAALAIANLLAIGVALRALRLRIRVSFRARRAAALSAYLVGHRLVGVRHHDLEHPEPGAHVSGRRDRGTGRLCADCRRHVLFTPLRPAVIAFLNVFRTDFVAALAEGRYRRLNVTIYAVCALIVLLCATAGAAIWLIWPYLDAHIFAGKFDHASMPLIVTLSGISAAIYLTYNVPLALIQAAGHFRPVALATTFGALVGLCTVSILLSVTTVAWSLAGVVAGEAVCGIYLWIAAHRILRQHTAPAWAARPAQAEVRT